MKYVIKQSRHYSSKAIWKFFNFLSNRNKLAYSVTFSDTCWYPEEYVSKSGWNKVFGFGSILHHWNSARFVWQPDFENHGKLRIAAYVYDRGEWTAHEFSSVLVGAARSMSIWATQNSYRFMCGTDSIEIEHSNPIFTKKLWPYFGGWDRAYKDMWIKLIRIDDIEWNE
jgi:hypothetical protein